jgi:hypothetical protein
MNNEILKNVPIFKCRASQIGSLMTNGRSKEPTMGETAKNYVKEWVISQLTGHRKEIQSKYLTKGLAVEDAALVRASKYYGIEFTKNNERKEDDYFTGEWDSIGGDRVIDVKSSWDAFTFPYFDEQPSKGYYEQLQVYMALTGIKKASLVYCLENATTDEIEKRAWSIAKGLDFEEPEIEHWQQAESEMTYDHLPDWMRIKVYEFERNDELIEQMQQRVIEARGYILADVMPSLEKMSTNFNNK